MALFALQTPELKLRVGERNPGLACAALDLHRAENNYLSRFLSALNVIVLLFVLRNIAPDAFGLFLNCKCICKMSGARCL